MSNCKNCQYFREGKWCSNSQSPFNRQDVPESGSCQAFSVRGKKAPAGMRAAIKILEKLRKAP